MSISGRHERKHEVRSVEDHGVQGLVPGELLRVNITGTQVESAGYITGYQGRQGTQGALGDQGNQGDIGPQGVQGTGPQGVQGALGDQGNQGDIGPQGVQGTGPQGVQGALGDQGNQGDIGPQGVQGTGPQGVQGALGDQGNQGDIGPQGVQGNQGNQGDIGPQGVQGIGPQGNQGILGPQGNQGSQGAIAAYSSSFSVADWGSSSGGYYSLAFNHGLDSYNINVEIWDQSETYPEVVGVSSVALTSSNQILIKVPDSPDNRFDGRIVINGAGGAVAIEETARIVWFLG